MLSNAIAVLNAKGGVGKTTLAANLAGVAAAQGWRTLILDCDGQANLHRSLGYPHDGGVHLGEALLGKTPLTPRPDPRRPGLFYVAGGKAIDEAALSLAAAAGGGNLAINHRLDETLAPVADDFDLVVIDSPPREMFLRTLILMASHFVVIPTDKDEAAFDGIADVLRSIGHVRNYGNPALEVLRVLRFRMGSKAMAAETAEAVAAVLDTEDLTVETTIRSALRAADSQRKLGLLAHEYEERVNETNSGLTWAERMARPRVEARLYSSSSAGKLALDWWMAVKEILDAYSARVSALAATETPNAR